MGWKTIKKANALNFQKQLETSETLEASETSSMVESPVVEEVVTSSAPVETVVENTAIETNEVIDTEESVEESSQLEISLPDIGEIPLIETSLETADLSETVQEVKKTSKKKKS